MYLDHKLSRASLGRRILIVDDCDDAAWSLAVLLQFAGHTVHVANDGRKAVEFAKRLVPEIIFMDLAMPGMDGFETAWRIRRREGGHSILICALTAYDSPEFRERSKEVGFDHHLAKPADWEDLAPVLEAATAPQRHQSPHTDPR